MLKGEIATIGKYRILGQIGEGAMGVVYRAHDPVLNRIVAVKVMSDALARDSELRDRFLREAQAAGSLQHPNVVTIFDFGDVDGHPFIAMEFVEGADLSEILQNKSPLTLVEKVDVLIDVLNGLSYAHKHGIVHRDVKPANIRIDEDGRARIMDFGIAHLNSSSMTRTGAMVGTPAYMSPEQITGSPISAACDIFAIGAVMYELLTGVQAFRGDSLQSVMYKIVSAPTPEITMDPGTLIAAEESSVSKSLAAIVVRSLAKEPSGRFPTALDMVAALADVRARVVDGHQIVRSSGSLRASVARVMADAPESKMRRTRRRRAVGAGVGVVVALAIPVVWSARDRGAVSTSPPAKPPAASVPVQDPVAPAPTTIPAPTAPPPQASPSPAASTSNQDDGKARPASPSAKELGLFRALQSTALDARRRAVDAGASAEQLSAGDAHNRTANVLVLQGKTTEAADRLHQATTMWSGAERTARQAAATAAASTAPRTEPVEAPKPQLVPPPVTAAAPAPQTQATQAQPTQLPAPPPPNPSAEIAAAVATYVRALESRDVTAVRRAYPGITPDQAKGWEQFFSTLRSLRVSLTIDGLVVSGAAGDAKLVGAYDFVTDAGRVGRQPVSFQASFRREGTIWQLVSVH